MQFASFNYPRQCFTLPRQPLRQRLADFKTSPRRLCGPYYQAEPCPRQPHAAAAVGFYLASDFAPGLRWEYAHKLIRCPRGWYCDPHGDGDTISGVVFRLPHGRGFLAGWTMGKGMASSLDTGHGDIYASERDAALAADSMAERAAERERDYQAAEDAKREADEASETCPTCHRPR